MFWAVIMHSNSSFINFEVVIVHNCLSTSARKNPLLITFNHLITA